MAGMTQIKERVGRLKNILLLVLPAAVFLLVSFFILEDYGPNIDSQKNFLEGENNLTYLISGRADPEISRGQNHGAFTFMLADASRRILSEGLNLFDPTSARHVIGPLLTAGFIPVLLWFVKRHWDLPTALVTVAALITFPEFLGHTFNNLKDIPLLIFFSLAIMCFAEWMSTGRRRYLYGHFIFLGAALSIKLYALLVPIILLAWKGATWVSASDRDQWRRREVYTLPHYLLGALITLSIVLIFYMPSFWALDSKLEFLKGWMFHAKSISLRPQGGWDYYSLQQVIYRTPLLMLMFAGLGLMTTFLSGKRTPLNQLLSLWLVFPVLLPCLPYLFSYQSGMRLFLVFLVPFSIFSGQGVSWLAGTVSRQFKLPGYGGAVLLAGFALLLGGNLWALMSTHPYQTTYFNLLAGGLKGAQEKGIRSSCDYWLNSYKEAGRWLETHAARNANVITVYYSAMPSQYNTGLMRFSLVRDDLRVMRFQRMPDPTITPRNSYVVFVPFHYLQRQRNAIDTHEGLQVVFRITRQEGEILTIYYKP
jgi:hypothetical protein